MFIITVNELGDVVSRPGLHVVKVFNRDDPVYEIDEAYNAFSKQDRYRRASFSVMDVAGVTSLSSMFYKLEKYPAFIIYDTGKPIAVYTGISSTTLNVMLDRYL